MAALKIPDIRFFIGSVAFFTLASRALAVVIGFQIYQITHNALALGWLGLVEAIPALSLVLFGGYAADHFNRHKILLVTRAASCLCAIALALLSWHTHATSVMGLYAVIFLAGIARGFADPAGTAFEAQIIPKELTVNGASWISSMWITCSIAGPGAIGFAFDAWGARGSYLLIAGSFFLSCFWTCLIRPRPQIRPEHQEPVLKSIASGWHFVFRHQPLWAAMVLDLFAVFFGGAMILLPIYANDILHVGAKGLGLLNAAPSVDTNTFNASNLSAFSSQLAVNLHELRMTFLWPQLPNGNVGGGRQTFRVSVAGQLAQNPANGVLFYYNPQFFTNSP